MPSVLTGLSRLFFSISESEMHVDAATPAAGGMPLYFAERLLEVRHDVVRVFQAD